MANRGKILFKNGDFLTSERIVLDEENGVVTVQRRGDSGRMLFDRYNWDEISNIIQEE